MDIADVLFIAADPREFAGAMRYWRDIRPIDLPVHWSRSAVRKGRPIVAIANGAGPKRAGAAVAVPYRALCNVGFCGALDAGLGIGDIVVSEKHLQPKTTKPHRVGRVVSMDHVIQTAEEKRSLNGMAVEMEAAGLEGREFYCIKSVSDLVDETFANDFNAAIGRDGRIDISSLLISAMQRPFTRVPELIRLARRSKIASDNLGAFLDACEF